MQERFQQRLSLCPPGHPDRAALVHEAVIALLTHYERRGDVGDLNEGVALAREALTLEPSGHPDRSASLIHLALAVGNRYELSGEVVDLNESIALYRENDELPGLCEGLTLEPDMICI